MALTFGNSNGTLNGVTQVDVVVAPASSTKRLVKVITFFNRDTVNQTINLRYSANGTLRYLDAQLLTPGTAWIYEVTQVLPSTTDKLVAVMNAAVTTTAPDFVASWADQT